MPTPPQTPPGTHAAGNALVGVSWSLLARPYSPEQPPPPFPHAPRSNGRSRHASSRSSSGHGLAHGPPHAGARPSSGFLTLQEASQQLNERRDRREAAGAASQTSSGLAPPAGGTRGSRHGPAALAPPEPPAAAAEPRASSLPRPLASGGAGAGAATAGSGPGGPVSPDPAVSAALRRVSSQPPDGLSSDSSLHSSATPAGSAPVDRLRPGASGDADGDGSSSAGSLHIHFGGSGGGDAYGSSGDDAAAAAAGHPGASAALAVTLGSQVPPVPARPPLHQHSHLPARWQPAHDLSVHGHQPHHRQQQQLCVAPSGPHARAPAPASLVAALAAAGDDDDEALVSPAHSGVSLLTYQLRGGSGASSCCTSREASTRGGVARSREASVRSGSRRWAGWMVRWLDGGVVCGCIGLPWPAVPAVPGRLCCWWCTATACCCAPCVLAHTLPTPLPPP